MGFAAYCGLAGLCVGIRLGLAGGEHLRRSGEGFIGEAEQFWLEAFLVHSPALMIPRFTRTAGACLIASYSVALLRGYWTGDHCGNSVGWHAD